MDDFLYEKQNDRPEMEAIYHIEEEYAADYHLEQFSMLLPKARELLFESEHPEYVVKSYGFRHFLHGLKACKMLIDLNLPLSWPEVDEILTVELCHVLLEIVLFPEGGEELTRRYGVRPDILFYAKLLMRGRDKAEGISEQEHYEKIQQNKPALMVQLVEMSILTEQLHRVSLNEVQEYLRLIECYFFPMCIYAKEHYTDLTMEISTLMEKVRLLSYVTEILSERYRARERALRQEMLGLQEENARIRISIRQMEDEKK